MTDRNRELVLPDDTLQHELSRRTRRNFLVGGLTAAVAGGGYLWMKSDQGEDDIPKLERKVLGLNGSLAEKYQKDSRLTPSYSLADVRPLKANGNIGLDHPVESDWSIRVQTGASSDLKLALSDIRALPKADMITRFCCIEGWSTVVHWAGARFSDFTQKYFPPGKQLPPFVYMATPDGEYYVGLDMKSALHPQTLLAYEMNGEPLTEKHGAPLRLVIPVKYGVKNIKRIGSIQFTDKKPGDYWADDGYDWFAGL